jgi:hypothetical protein
MGRAFSRNPLSSFWIVEGRRARGGIVMLWNLPYIVVVVTTMIGLVTILFKQNLIKVLLGINGFEAKLLASENR